MLEKHFNQPHIIERLHSLFYLGGFEFLHDIAIFSNEDNDTLENAIELAKDILEYAFLSNRILIKHSNDEIYNKSNYYEVLKILEINFEKFLDFSNGEFPYHYSILYTDEWIIELKKIRLWEE